MFQYIDTSKRMVDEKDLLTVTIIVPVFNAEKTIGKCICALLVQDYPREKFQIIIADNGSVDSTGEIIQQYPVDMVVELKRGSYKARNRALQQATGEIIAFTDSDCVPEPDWLRQLVSGFDDDLIAGCGGKIEDFLGKGWVERYSNQNVLRQDCSMAANTVPHPYIIGANMAYRRRIFDQLGGFDGRFISGGDTDMGWRVSHAGFKLKYIPQAVVHHFHRASVYGLYRQYFRYGIGRHCLTKKHFDKNGDSRYRYSVLKSLKRTNTMFYSWLACVFESSLLSSSSKVLFLDFIRQGAHFSGLIVGKFIYAGKL